MLGTEEEEEDESQRESARARESDHLPHGPAAPNMASCSTGASYNLPAPAIISGSISAEGEPPKKRMKSTMDRGGYQTPPKSSRSPRRQGHSHTPGSRVFKWPPASSGQTSTSHSVTPSTSGPTTGGGTRRKLFDQDVPDAMAALQKRKAELTRQLELKRLQREVEALEKELASEPAASPPPRDERAEDNLASGPGTRDQTASKEKMPASQTTQGAGIQPVKLGSGDVSLTQLREDAALRALVSAKYSNIVGTDSKQKTEKDLRRNQLIMMLPDELLEIIFCSVPMLDLCLNLSLVCPHWRELIQRETFIPWKKKYHKLKQGCPETVQEVNDLMRQQNITATKDGCLLQLIRYMCSWQFKRAEAATLSRLQTHPLSTAAQDLVRTRAKDCLIDGVCPAWSVVAAVVVLSTSVSDIQTLLCVLTRHPTPCMIVDVLEGLYCIATLLFSLRPHFKINMGLHYRLFYTLYLYENASSVSCGQLSKTTPQVRLSHEQLRIINHELKPGETIKIIGFAGTGKTRTLMEYARLHPKKKFLLLVYNKSVQEQAIKIFPGNVECRTVHSLAYEKRFKPKLSSSLKEEDIRRFLKKYVSAKHVLVTLTCFINSASDAVSIDHVSEFESGTGERVNLTQQKKMEIAEAAQQIWDRMSAENANFFISHDVYLKWYQLRRPQITDYDYLLIDEAHDLTPAINDILKKQNKPKIMVGDPHQQIYTFRGAMQLQFTPTYTYHLTQSFRFGPEIAYVAACLLDGKGVKTKTLVGSNKTGTVLGTRQGQEAVICRMNFTLFNEAVKLIDPSKPPVKIAFVGGLEWHFDRIMDIYYLYSKAKDKIKDKFIRRFHSLWDLKESAKDVELSEKIRIVEIHGHDTPKLLQNIQEKTTKDLKTADVVLTSAHKAKSLEFDTVRLADDFCRASFNHNVEWAQVAEDEKNLLYVAVTRAKKSLLLTKTVMTALQDVQEQFIYPTLTQELLNSGVPLTCTNTRCGQAVPADNLLTMNRRTVTYGTGHGLEAPPGPLCPNCSQLLAPGFHDLLCDPRPGEEAM